MTTQAIKAKLSKTFPEASKILVRQFATNYPGSMRGMTDIRVYGVSYNYNEFHDKCKQALGSLYNTFVSETDWRG
jgi:hypothetical protein